MKSLLTASLLVSFTACFCQQKPSAHSWGVEKILPTSEGSGVAGLVFREKKGAVAFVTGDGGVPKELSLPGRVVGLSKWNDQVIAFYVDTWDKWKVVKEIHAVLIDPRKMAVVTDQIAFTNPGKNTIAYTVANDDHGNFGCLIVRITNVSGAYDNNLPKDVRRMGESSSITAVSFSDPFKPLSRPVPSAAIGSDYLGAFANRNGELALLSYGNGQVVAEKFGSGGQMAKKLSVPLPDYTPKADDWNDGIRGLFNPQAPDILCFSLANPDDRSSHRNLSTFAFDFAAGKVSTLESGKPGAGAALPSTKHFKSAEDFRPDGILYAGDTLVVSKEIRYNEIDGQNVRFVSAGTVVSLYDKQYRLLHQFFLDRYLESFSNGGGGWTYGVRDGRLLALCNVITGAEHWDHLCYAMDLGSYKVQMKEVQWGNVPHSNYPRVANIFWFRDNWLKDLVVGSSSGHYDSWLVPISYP